MTTRRSMRYVVAGLFSGIMVFLLWPLPSGNWSIQYDRDLQHRKHEFLDQPSEQSHTPRPNVLLIMADDLGMADISYYGHSAVRTPHIDRLAAGGTAFSQAYVTAPVCSPSRAAILTGQYQQRFGFEYQMHDRYLKNRLEYIGFKYFVDSDPWKPKWTPEVPDREAVQRQGLPPWVVTLPELLRKRGYRTGISGKWHLGWSEGQKPLEMGFDFQYGFYASHSLYAPEGTEGIVDQRIPGDWTDKYIWSGQRNGPHAIHRHGEKIVEDRYLTHGITEEAIAFMTAQEHKPFFLLLSYNAPHTPLQAPVRYVQSLQHIEDPIQRVYSAMIKCLDDDIGRVLDHLESTGLADSTLVIFLSDNGGAEYTLTTNNGPYKGGKITDLEGGLRVPMVLNWPGMIPAGRWYEKPVISLDIFATIVGATRLSLPAWQPSDGKDLLPHVQGKRSRAPHQYLYWQRGFSKAVRSGDWKLLINEEKSDTVLFNLTKDPYEHTNLYKTNREVAQSLAIRHRAWSSELQKPTWPSMVYYHYNDGVREYYFDQ